MTAFLKVTAQLLEIAGDTHHTHLSTLEYIQNEHMHAQKHKLITKATNKMQLCMLIYYSLSALHVSGDVFVHHQKHLSVFTAPVVFTNVTAGWCHSSNASMTPAGSDISEHYQML
jgi:hypothetical protein